MFERGWIYIVRAKGDLSGPFKIGWATRPSERLKLMHWGSPVELEFVDVRMAPRSFEGELHRQLKKFRVRGEWYKLSPSHLADLLTYIHKSYPRAWTEEIEKVVAGVK